MTSPWKDYGLRRWVWDSLFQVIILYYVLLSSSFVELVLSRYGTDTPAHPIVKWLNITSESNKNKERNITLATEESNRKIKGHI